MPTKRKSNKPHRKVHYFHYRSRTKEGSILPRAGACRLLSSGQGSPTFGISVCSPDDNFWKKKGRNEAEGLARSNLKLGRAYDHMSLSGASELARGMAADAIQRVIEKKAARFARESQRRMAEYQKAIDLLNGVSFKPPRKAKIAD